MLHVLTGFVLKEAPFDAWVHGRGVDVPILIGNLAFIQHTPGKLF